jgi:hypothetical protein
VRGIPCFQREAPQAPLGTATRLLRKSPGTPTNASAATSAALATNVIEATMKVSKLIAALQELDPTGEVEVVVGSDDISYADRQPGYYDGWYELLQRNDRQEITGVMVCTQLDKIKLVTCGARDLFWEEPDLVVEYDSENAERRAKDKLEIYREKIKKELEDNE